MADDHDSHPVSGRSHLDRRTVVRGAAWSVPVVMVAAAAPAIAASQDAAVTIDPTASGCHPNNGNDLQRWRAPITFRNAGPGTASITGITFTVSPSAAVNPQVSPPSLTIPPGGEGSVLATFLSSGKLSATRILTFSYTLNTTPVSGVTVSVTYSIC